ncbi:DUF1269 domain-containing protein [Granulicella arctica]|uniref:DUF1269 domain-containing protein n=1 Tax=Granulicella arctica TaxID=940613 RepID=UPI0021E04016|nr:DUF1269 domain-containing protein [Granulicella arctica]
MAELIVVGFANNIHRASGVLDELRVLDDAWILQLRDAVAVHREPTGDLHMDQSYKPTGWQGAGWGGALGLLIGATLAIPFTAGASASIAAGAIAAAALGAAAVGVTSAGLDASFWKDEFGIPEGFVEEVSRLVLPGSSAIYAIVESDENAAIVAGFQRYGGAVLRTVVSEQQRAKIERAILNASR